MDPILQMFLSWQFIIFCLAISAVIFVIRSVFEYLIINYITSVKNLKLWKELILPILPVSIGCFLGWQIKSYPYPPDLSFTGGRIIFGMVAGLLSGLVYRVIKGILYNKTTDVPNITLQVPQMQPMQTNTIQEASKLSDMPLVDTNIPANSENNK